MAMFDWKPFLGQWSRTILASPEVEYFDLSPQAVQSGWLGLPGATEAQIAAAEARLGVRLPPSYRSFLQVTNGWQHTGLGAAHLLPVEAIDRFQVLHPDWLDAWMGGFTSFGEQEYQYHPAVDEVNYHHLGKTLAVSEEGDLEILLLNPEVVSADGEWEAWSFVDDGAGRYETFWHLLQSQHGILKQVNQTLARQVRPSDPPEALVTKLPGLIAELDEKQAQFRSLAATDTIGVHQGTADGLEVAITRVRALQSITDPGQLREKLQALAAELAAEAGQLEAPLHGMRGAGVEALLMRALHSGDALSQLNPLMESARAAGKAQGLHTGANLIRWYMEQWSLWRLPPSSV